MALSSCNDMGLNRPNVVEKADVLVVGGIESLALRSNSKALPMLVRITNVNNERYAGGTGGREAAHERGREVDAFDDEAALGGGIGRYD